MDDTYKILIVDQNVSQRQSIESLLRSDGHHVTIASEVLAGPTSIEAIDYNLVILDITTVCARNSRECYQQIGRLAGAEDKPMIVLSDDGTLEFELLRAADYLVSPVNTERLTSVVGHLKGQHLLSFDFELVEEAFLTLKDYLTDITGIYFSSRNLGLLEESLQIRMQALLLGSYTEYLDYLMAYGESRNEFKKLISLLTVGDTQFFRYPLQIDLFRDKIFPELIENNRQRKMLRIWSAGCSTGEEPYSMAILLREYFPELHDWTIQIVATDINRRSLKAVREGIYCQRTLRQVSPELVDKYFTRIGNLCAINPELKEMLMVRDLNLMEECYPAADNGTRNVDLLLCRNVMIYFQLPTIQDIITRFSQVLRPGGYLMLGHAERLHDPTGRFESFTQDKVTCYRLSDTLVK
jgi:chemotaxis protein methyltransferase CheR